jgi:hypothetical protein
MAAIRQPRLLMRIGWVRDGMVATAAGRLAQPQAARTLTTASTSSAFTGSSGAPSAKSARSVAPQPTSVRRPSARPLKLDMRGFSQGGVCDPDSSPNKERRKAPRPLARSAEAYSDYSPLRQDQMSA